MSFENVKKNFGFGCMRLPMAGEDVDTAEFQRMVDAFMENGFNYFDTAHVYLDGKSETALRECLVSRYPRESFVLTNKLSGSCFKTEAEIRPFFESQLEACGVDYFDFYLMHAQNARNFETYKRCRAYETAFALKAEGKVRHVGLSFHDKGEVLERILTEYPEVEVVQIQFNYADYDDLAVESRKCYEVCRKHGKPVIVMEPVRGGSLSKHLPDGAKAIFDGLHGGSYASYAFETYKRCRAYETAFALKAEGKVRHVGLSFHDKGEVLERILTEYPEVEVVQIQFNYADYDDLAVESRKCYEVCRKHGKPVIVMEPVRGGSLSKHLPDGAKAIFDGLHGGSYASYAIRFAASFEGMMMVLSGMSDMQQMNDNISFMKEFLPLDERERAAVDEVCALFRAQGLIPCTACRYCVDGCPKHIAIPSMFSCLNKKKMFPSWNAGMYYHNVCVDDTHGKASDCLKCGKCEAICPQGLPIRELLVNVAEAFETEEEDD